MLADKYSRLLECAKAEQVSLLDYACPHCGLELEALQPPESGGEDAWDSIIECPKCLKMHFRVAFFDGGLKVWSLEA